MPSWGPCVEDEVVSALSAMEANDPKETIAICAAQSSAKCSCLSVIVTRPCNRVSHHLGVCHTHQSEWGILLIVQLPLKAIVPCPCESDPALYLWRSANACVDKTAQVQKQCVRLSIPPARCFDDER